MKKLIIFAGALLLLAAGTAGFFASRPMSAQEALILKNVEAIARGEGNIISGRFSDCVDGGVETGTFQRTRTITILGVSLSGEKGQVYTVVWERWSCVNGNASDTCDTSESGVRVTSSSVN
ncbi:MAG TPA: hypothetical protein DEQ30_05635 [Porphyromonadaceae bacterium]|nr:hypothetical protein [Porphyromonadaceae bacterium]